MTRKNILLSSLAILIALAGLALLVLVFLPYPALKSFLDGLTSDHDFNSLKPFNGSVFKAIFGAGSIFAFLVAAATGLRWWRYLAKFLARLRRDARLFLSGLRPRKDDLGYLAVLVFIMGLAVVLRLQWIKFRFDHDEAYTYMAFGRTLFSAISDYHLPNNHVFHSILVFLATRLFGPQPWVVRLPACLAGVLLVPATYWLGKRLYDRWTGLGAAFLVAWFPSLISYSTNARGYTLIALFTVVTLALGDIVRRQNNFFVWLLISIFSALGFYTIPTMAFPFGVLFLWLLLENGLFGKSFNPSYAAVSAYPTRKEFFYSWSVSGFSAAILTLILYIPVLVYSGPQKLFGNEFVAPVPWKDFFDTIIQRFIETWAQWTYRVPVAFIALLVVGFLIGLFFHYRISSIRIPLQVAAVLWIVILLLVQRPNAWSRVWVFMQPLFLLWSAAGFLGLLGKLRLKLRFAALSLAPVVLGIFLCANLWQVVRLVPQLPYIWSIQGGEERVVLYIKNDLGSADLIVSAPSPDAAVWYYSTLHGISDNHFDRSATDFQRAFVVVYPVENQTLASVLQVRGPAPETLNMSSSQLLTTIDALQIYSVTHK